MPLVLGVGESAYQVVRRWGTLPRGHEFGTISSIAVDSHDRVYVYQRGNPPIIVFDPDGTYNRSLGEGQIDDPHGIFIGPDDHIYVTDRDSHRVLKFTIQGELVLVLGSGRPSKDAPFNHPADVAVSANGDIYVADGYGNARVHRFSADGNLLLSWGAPGTGDGELSVPHGIWIDDSERVLVADRDNNRIQIFNSEGGFINQWTGLYRPTDIYMDEQGRLYVTELNTRVRILDANGITLACNRSGNQGHGIWGDKNGNLYIVSTYANSVEKYELL